MAADEYFFALDAFDGVSVAALFITWLLIVTPLAYGPQSLVRSFIVAFPFTHALNFALMVRAITLSPNIDGYASMFSVKFEVFDGLSPWLVLAHMVTGVFFGSPSGLLIFVGKYVGEKTFVLPHVFVACMVALLLNAVNLVKVAAFMGYYQELTWPDFTPYLHLSFLSNHCYGSIPVVLSKVSGANFWLFAHFAFLLGIGIPILSFTLEMIITSFAESLPGRLAPRTKFPESVVSTGVIGLIGFGVSIALLYGRSVWHDIPGTLIEFFGGYAYILASIFIMTAIVPSAFSNALLV